VTITLKFVKEFPSNLVYSISDSWLTVWHKISHLPNVWVHTTFWSYERQNCDKNNVILC